MNENNIALEIHSLSVSYQQKPVLWEIDFSLPVGKITGIVGPNGSGKTTLIRAILGFLPIDSGYVEFFGQSLKQYRSKISYIPQRNTIDWQYPISVLEVVQMARFRPGFWVKYTKKDKEKALEALEKVQLLDLADRQIGQLSGGQQQRVFIARALAQDADFFIMDEPFVGVDTVTEEIILNILRELKNNNKNLIIVHHDLETVKKYFDFVVLLNTRLIGVGEVDKLFKQDYLQRTFGAQSPVLTALGQKIKTENFPFREIDFNDKKYDN